MSECPKILVVDDNDLYRGALKQVLLKEAYQVTEATDGQVAQHILGIEKFDVVISDIQMPTMDGIALLKWIKAGLETPVILITGFSEILETAEACRLGASDFLLKPFHSDDIVSSIKKLTTREAPAEETTDLDEQYCGLPISDFVTGSSIHFNLFLRISAAKYIRIAYKGEDISLERIRAYNAKGVENIYIRREDFAKYVGFNLDLARRVQESRTISTDKKRNFLRYTGEVVVKSLYVDDLDQHSFAAAKMFTETALGLLAEKGEAIAILDAMNSHADFLYAHSVAVSMYSVMIARAMGWNSSPTLFKVSIGGLFHDIGLKEIPRDILEKSRATMSQEDRTIYETHPIRGMEILNSLQGTPSDAILIAYQHHEDCTGFGYPKKLAKSKIHPMARAVAVADQFCEFAIKWGSSPGVAAPRAIELMLQAGTDRLDPEPVAALKKIFGIE